MAKHDHSSRGNKQTREARQERRRLRRQKPEQAHEDQGDFTPRATTYLEKFVPENDKQRLYMNYVKHKRIVFALGPSGTGKTFCPTSLAAEWYLDKSIERVIVTRPMVGCDEDEGTMPGNAREKFEGWVRPFMEVFQGKMRPGEFNYALDSGRILAQPLAGMRGSTHRNAVIILDEAQNTTPRQLKMLLTRMGSGSRLIIAGDEEQSDLPRGKMSGLLDALNVLEGIDDNDIGVIRFDESEIVRDPIVAKVIKAYRQRDIRAQQST